MYTNYKLFPITTNLQTNATIKKFQNVRIENVKNHTSATILNSLSSPQLLLKFVQPLHAPELDNNKRPENTSHVKQAHRYPRGRRPS